MPEETGRLPLPLPVTPSEVTPAWLTRVLGEGHASWGEVTAVAWEQIGQEQGLTGVVARLHLCYDNAHGDGPPSLIAKFPMAARDTLSAYRTAQQRDAATARRYYERCAREVRFYREIARQSAVPVPHLYYGEAEEPTGNVVMLLEDCGTGRVGDVLQGCSPEEAAAVVEGLAPVHARWWPSTEAAPFPWLPDWGGDYHARLTRYNRQVPRFLAHYGHQLSPSIRDIVERLQALDGAVLAVLDAAPATVIHADLHLDNVIFNPPGIAPAAVVFDWQSVARGPAAVDVVSFVCGSLAVADRRQAEDELFRRYHALLVAHGVAGYSVNRLRDDGRFALLRRLAGVVGWLAAMDGEHLIGRERTLVEAAIGDGRLVAALLDYGVADLLA